MNCLTELILLKPQLFVDFKTLQGLSIIFLTMACAGVTAYLELESSFAVGLSGRDFHDIDALAQRLQRGWEGETP